MKRFLFLTICCFVTVQLVSQSQDKDRWVDSILTQMTLEEKIGQVFTIRAFSKNDNVHIRSVKDQIRKYKVGGVCFFQGSPVKQASLVNQYQSLSQIPLLVSIDGEWGLGMRFPKQAVSFPKQLTIGAINDHQLIYLMGKEIGRQCKLIGARVNFAPDVDINNNAANPVINVRSFGEDRYNVAAKAYAYMRGLQDVDVMACAKHFPGHGDTGVDSHFDLPVIPHDRAHLDSIELFPFDMMIKQGIASIMVAHLQVPALDDRPNHPTTVSEKVADQLLRKEMGFDGLIFTDGMEMKAITKHYPPGEADLAAFLAGNDIILLPENLESGVAKFKEAIANGKLSLTRLEESVKRILAAKFDVGLHKNKGRAASNRVMEQINSPEAQVLKSKIYEKAITLLANRDAVLPINELSKTSFGSVSLGSEEITTFQNRMNSYADIDHFAIAKDASEIIYKRRLNQLASKDVVFVSVHSMSRSAKKDFGVTQDQINFIRRLSAETNVMVTLFGSPYAAQYFNNIDGLMIAYEEDKLAQDAAAQAIFGANDITGKMPVTASDNYKVGAGIILPGINRLGFALPEAVGLNSDTLLRIEKIVNKMIGEGAAPGCQILVAKNNKVVYHRSFGYHTYDRKVKSELNDIYDVASVTKVMASTLSAMHLQDQGKFDLHLPISRYIPEEDTTTKASIIYEDMLSHVSGLAGWIPFYKNTLDKETEKLPSTEYYRRSSEPGFDVMVTPSLFLRSDYPDSIWRTVFSSTMRENNNYRYSDLAFYILNRTVKNISGHEVDGYAEMNFYNPLGLRRTLFNPYRIFDSSLIPPTEHDTYWRNEVIQGTVHDMGAAMLGGVSGHAGLFSNSMELSVLMQMLLNGGHYGGRQYLSPSTINYYTKRHWRSSRRGIGFDMKELDPDRMENMSVKASRHAFGHLGFTGIAAFADPDHDLIYIFLSNRTYPSMNNNKFSKGDYRPKIQTVVYNAMMTE